MNESSAKKGPILRWSIGTRLTIVFLALAIIPLSFIVYYNFTISKDKIIEVAEENLIGLSQSCSQTIGQILKENQRTSATLAGEPIAVRFLAASEEEREALAPEVNRTLKNFADTHPDYDAPGLLDAEGTVVATLEPRLLGKNRSFRDYFQASIKGKPYVSGILVGRGTGRPGVFLTNPVITVEGKIVGIDIVWLKADSISSIIDDITVGKGGIAFLVDQDGVVIAHPNHDLLYHSLGKLTPAAKEIIRSTIRFGVVKGTDTPIIPKNLGMDDFVTELTSGKNQGTYHYLSPLDNRNHVIGYSRVKDHPWTVVIDLPEARFLASIQLLQVKVWSSVGVLGVIVLFISILLARSITRPIRRLTGAAMAVEQGRPFDPSDIKDIPAGHDEIAHLGRVFSNMVFAIRQELAKRKQAEEELAEHRDHLEELVRERTAELEKRVSEVEQLNSSMVNLMEDLRASNESLEGTTRKLGNANKELEAFSYSVSHDLRAPLRTADGFSQILLEEYSDTLDEKAKHYIERVRAGAQNMAQLIGNILNLSHIGRQSMEKKEINVETIATKVYNSLEQEWKDRKVNFAVHQCPPALADPNLMRIVFMNLLSNVLKFTRIREEAEIEVGCEIRDEQTIFFVKDNGAGFDMKYADKLFSPFQRLHRAEEYEGSGIGLAIVQRIIYRHGGQIWVESKVDKRTTFYFTL